MPILWRSTTGTKVRRAAEGIDFTGRVEARLNGLRIRFKSIQALRQRGESQHFGIAASNHSGQDSALMPIIQEMRRQREQDAKDRAAERKIIQVCCVR